MRCQTTLEEDGESGGEYEDEDEGEDEDEDDDGEADEDDDEEEEEVGEETVRSLPQGLVVVVAVERLVLQLAA